MYIYMDSQDDIYIYILNKVILRAVSYIVFIRCRLIYNQHYAPYEHIYIYIMIYNIYIYILYIYIYIIYIYMDSQDDIYIYIYIMIYNIYI